MLAGIGARYTAAGTHALTLWAASEGMTPSYHNPLATTLGGYGGHSINSAGVQSYPSWTTGVRATVASLGQSYYTNIVAAFRAGNTLTRIFTAINHSPWCGGCQNGHYPVALWEALGKPTTQAPTGAITLTGPVVTPTMGTEYVAMDEIMWADLAYWAIVYSNDTSYNLTFARHLITSA